MFDLPEDMEVDSEQVSQLTRILDIFISIRRKPKQNVVSVMIKGIERNASKFHTLLQHDKKVYLHGYMN
jgi:protein bicaudal C